MSSASLPHAPTSPEIQEAFAQALITTGEQSFFAYVSVCADDEAAAAIAPVDAWFRASVTYDAAVAGCVTVLLPEALARELQAAFLGEGPDIDVPESDLRDLAGEFANVLCGSYLTSHCPDTAVPLDPPAVVRTDGDPGRPWTGATATVFAMMNDHPVILWFEDGRTERAQ
jgi:hypothetical protein